MELSIDFDRINPTNGSKHAAFEELVCQLAEAEDKPKGHFYRVEGAGGDGGVEAYHLLPNGNEYGWQAKYFPDGNLEKSRRKEQIRSSLDETLKVHPKCIKWYLALPFNLTPKTSRRGKAQIEWWEDLRTQYATQGVELVLWNKSTIISKLLKPENRGQLLYWFGTLTLDQGWFTGKLKDRLHQLRNKYRPDLHVPSEADDVLLCSSRGPASAKYLLTTIGEMRRDLRNLELILRGDRPVHNHPQVGSLLWRWHAALDWLTTCVQRCEQFCGGPLPFSTVAQVEQVIASHSESFGRVMQRVFTLRNHLAYRYVLTNQPGDDSSATLTSESFPEIELMDWTLEQFLAQHPQAYAFVNGTASGGMTALHVVDIANTGGLQLTDEDELELEQPYGDAPKTEDAFAPLDMIAEPTDMLTHAYAEEPRPDFYVSQNLSPAMTLLDETLVHHRSLAAVLLQELESTFVPAQKVIHVVAPPGSGKTHLFAHVAKRLVDAGTPAILLTGNLFTKDQPLEDSILELVGVRDSSWDDFLAALEFAANRTKTNAMILIDALNESPIPGLWKARLEAFEGCFRDSDRVCLAISCRSTYVNSVWEDGVPENSLLRLDRSEETILSMVQRYQRAYGLQIELTNADDYIDVFASPLYLRLFCEVNETRGQSGRKRVVANRDSIYHMFDRYLQTVAQRVAEWSDQDSSEVQELYGDLAQLFLVSPNPSVPWGAVKSTIHSRFGRQPWSRSVENALLSEELLLKQELDSSQNSIGMFAFDQLGDFIVGKYGILHRRPISRTTIDALDPHSLLSHPRAEGVLDYLAMALPLSDDCHLWEIWPAIPPVTVSCLRVVSHLPARLIRKQDVEWLESTIYRGFVIPAIRAMFECAMIPGHPIDVDVLYGWVDAMGSDRWRNWILLNKDLIVKLENKFDQRNDVAELAILSWLVKGAAGRPKLNELLTEFLEKAPWYRWTLSEYASGLEI